MTQKLHSGIYLREMKMYAHTKTYIQNFAEVLFIITPNWKQTRYPSMNEWLNKLWHICAMEYYSAIKIKVMIYTTTWMNHQRTVLSE